MTQSSLKQLHRPAGRPPQPPSLSSARITSAALKLIGRSGYRGLTLAALAKSLHVATSVLDNHVSSEQVVLLLVEAHLMGLVDVSAFSNHPWETAVSRWAHSYREVFASHLPLIPVIALLPVTDAPRTITMHETVTQGFLAAGWPMERIIDAIAALESFIYGSVYDVNAPANNFDARTRAPHSLNFSAAVVRRGNLDGANNADAAELYPHRGLEPRAGG